MSTMKKFFVLILLFCFATGFAQNNMEDVLYLKNGNTYRGTIIEQVPNVTYKIQIAGGSIFTVIVAEIEKITKEEKWQSPNAPRVAHPMDMHSPFMHGRMMRDTVPGYLKKRGHFMMIEFRAGINNASIRLVNGAKFGRFGFIGIGIGADRVSFERGVNFGHPNMFSASGCHGSDGVYLPLYVRYSGDILRKKITPFYYLEAGYAAHPNSSSMFSGRGNGSKGGPLAAVGFGVKFNTKGRVNFNLNLNATWRTNRYEGFFQEQDAYGTYTVHRSGWDSKVFSNLGFAIGF